MRRAVTVAVAAAAVASPIANAASIAKKRPVTRAKKRVITVKKRVAGTQGLAGRWGYVQVTLLVKKTTTIVGKHKTIKRQVLSLAVPIYPNHTDRSVFINEQALPLLEQEALNAHYTANIDMISGATDTSGGFIQSLQSALVKAKKV
jgi:uncharacterized protein with FMN-binding domain